MKLSIEDAINNIDSDDNGFEVKDLENDTPKSAGRPIKGKSKATNKICFMLTDEEYEVLFNSIDYKKKINTPNAVAKIIVQNAVALQIKEWFKTVHFKNEGLKWNNWSNSF